MLIKSCINCMKWIGAWFVALVIWFIAEFCRLLQWIWFSAYYTLCLHVIGQLYNYLMLVIQTIAMKISLSPHRALTFLVIYYFIGVGGVYYLKDRDQLVLSEPKQGVYKQDSNLSATRFSKEVEITTKSTISKKTDAPSANAQSPLSYIKESTKTEKNKSIKDISCKDWISPFTYTLDLLLPLFHINESSKCSVSDQGDFAEFIKFIYVFYQVIGTLLAGLTVFSWAGILQNRLSK